MVLRRHASGLLLGLGLLGFAPPAHAVLPLPPYPECGVDERLDTCPPDLTHSDGTPKGSTWEFLSFIPPGMKRPVRAAEAETGSGNGMDVAWRTTTGRFDVTVAVLDAGILWDAWEIRNKVLINTAELPLPQRADGSTCSSYDCNGDGLVNLQDYISDPRVLPTAGEDVADDRVDVGDLIPTFSNGRDDDGNGYIDDIAGWDFLWDDNTPYATNRFDHGSGVMQDIAAEGGEQDSGIGYCPNCSILPVRTGDSFMTDTDRLAQGIVYATDRGVKVIAMASGTVNNTSGLDDALEYAWSKGVLVVAAIGDELSYHHLYPGAANYLMAVHSIRYWPLQGWDVARTFLAYNGCNNYGTHLTVVAGTSACATGATAITAASAGLIFSAGRDRGLELHPDEVRAMLVNSATDINIPGSGGEFSPYFPSEPGWDVMFGYGRVNVGKAVADFRVPPQVHLLSPAWYSYIDAATTPTIDISARIAAPRAGAYDWRLEWAPGGDARDTDFEAISYGGARQGEVIDGLLYQWSVADIPRDKLDPAQPLEQVTSDDTVLSRFGKVNVHTITLRLVVTDDVGRTAEMRKAFFLHDDPDLLPGFPRFIGASGTSTPVIEDLDGDGIKDLIVGSASGQVYAMDGRTGFDLPGWPVEMPLIAAHASSSTNRANAASYRDGQVALLQQRVLSTVAIGDLDGDGEKEAVVATMDGLLYVYSPDGVLRSGFPVSREPVSDADTNEWEWFDPGFLSSPLLVDLDADGLLEIVQAGMDQKVYVWREDGRMQPGWPVKLEHSKSDQHIRGRIVSSPAAGDLNRDGIPDLVIGTNEYDPELYFPGYAYAISGRGNEEVDGPILPGWPQDIPGALNGLVPFVAEGVTMTPIIADVDHDDELEIALSGTAGCVQLYEANGRRTTQYHCGKSFWTDPATDELAGIVYVSNPIFADMDLDGDLELSAALSGFNYVLSLATSTWIDDQDHMLGLWDAATGESVPGWPAVMEDLATFMRPAAADIDGDGFPELVASSGGYVAHAFDYNGLDVPGWPKLTGGFVPAGVTVGDLGGDHFNDVVMVTQEGYIFAWSTQAPAGGNFAPTASLPSSVSSRVRATPGQSTSTLPAQDAPLDHARAASAERTLGANTARTSGIRR